MRRLLPLLAFVLTFLSFSCSRRHETDFVSVRDSHFVMGDDPVTFVGANFWYGAILASDGEGGDRDRLVKELDTLKSLGINNLRVLVGGDGPDGVPTRIEPTLQKSPGLYDETILKGLDYLLVEMAKRDMKAVLFLNNAWEWSGGFGMYLEWATGEPALIPAVSGYGPFMRKMAEFNTNRDAQNLFFDHLRNIVSRTNSITGVPYSEDPAIFSWQICNEPRPFSEDKQVVDGFVSWITEAAGIIHELDPNHMVSTGNEGAMGCNGGDYALTERLNECDGIDYVTAHIWPYNWSWISGDSPEDDIESAIEKTGEYIDRHIEMARRLNKPLVIEEFGYPRDGFRFSKDTPTTGRDRYLEYVFNRVQTSQEAGDVLSGANFWAWGGLAEQPQGHINWQEGDDYCGDPAQEQQGLNSVYVSDSSTLDIIRQASEALNNVLFGKDPCKASRPLDIKMGDPYVLLSSDGNYYMYGTTDGDNGFSAYKSEDLKNWSPVGVVYEGHKENSWTKDCFWAPEVYERDGKYYMLFSSNTKENPNNDLEVFRIGVAVSESPEGPFEDMYDRPIFDPGYPIIDADVFFDEDGRCYLYYSRCCYKHAVESEVSKWARENGLFDEIEESWVYGVELEPDFSGVIGEPQLMLCPPATMSDAQSEWESRSVTCGEANRRWTEGSFLIKKDGIYYMMYSANFFGGENYAIGYATATSPLGPYTKSPDNPLLQKNTEEGGDITGVGHNSITYSKDGTKMYCVYHGRTYSTGEDRVVFISEIEAGGGRLRITKR